MKPDRLRNIVELAGIFGILASLVFVGLELRASNVQARAAAFQAIGIATSEFHQTMDDRLDLLFETTLLQVERGLLEESAIENLGFGVFGDGFLSIPGVACLWPGLSQGPGKVGPQAQLWIENGTPPEQRVNCPIDFSTRRHSHGEPANS